MALTEKAGMGTATAQRNELLSTLKNDIDAGNNISQEGLTGVLLSSLRDKSAAAADVELQSVASELARMLTAENPATLKKILVDLEGGGNILDILKNVRFNNVLPGLVNQLTKPGFIGNQSGNLSGQIDPNFLQDFLNDDQRAITQ
jgi:hypothetical protein|tara:strand:- start:319 stop:756 length:438 start_codon:yes stop_codon:yes gene_type:complete